MFDVPASGKDPDPTYPLVRGKLDADGPRHQPVEIEFTNDSEAPVQATFQPLLLHVDNDENQFFEPERRDAVLLPGETPTAEFTIDTSLVPDNMHYILGVILANLDVYAGFETTVVGGEAEYYPGSCGMRTSPRQVRRIHLLPACSEALNSTIRII